MAVENTQLSENFDSNIFYEDILREEGIPVYKFPLGFQLSQPLAQGCENFFGDPYLPDHDPRKNLAHAYMQLDSDIDLRFFYENASLSYYLSENPSYRRRGTRAMLVPNVRQMARAIHNIGAFNDLYNRFESTRDMFHLDTGLDIQLARTDNISPTNLRSAGSASRKLGITPCPEAIYQLRLFENGQYIARVGFNIHKENGQKVVSIVNLQGAEGVNFDSFKDIHGQKPVNILLERLLAFSQTGEEPLRFRGITNHPKGNPVLYYSAFSRFFRRKLIEPMKYTPKPRYPNDTPED